MSALLVVHHRVVVNLTCAERAKPPGDVEPWYAPRTLPIRVDPLPQESLESWWEALASRIDATWGEILRGVGVCATRGNTASYWAARANVSLTTRQVSTISRCTGVGPRRIRAMTLQPWIKDTSFRRPSVACMRLTGSRFCPSCLDERGGRWRVWWRLRWAFACPTHECLLADVCSACGGLQRTAPPRANEVPNLGSCTRWISQSGETHRCCEPLWNTPVVRLDADAAVVVQQQLLCLIRAGHVSSGIYASSPVPSAMFARDLQTLGKWILRQGQTDDVASGIADLLGQQLMQRSTTAVLQPLVTNAGGRMTCSRPATDAAIACLALPILQADDVETAAHQLQWLMSAMRRRGSSASAPRNVWRRGTSPPLDGLRQRLLSAQGLRAL